MKPSGLDEQQALNKLQIKSVPASGWDSYKYLQEIWQKHGITTFKDSLQWYNNKDVVPALEAMQKMVQLYHQKKIAMLNLDVLFQIWQIVVCTNQPMKNSTLFAKVIEICARKLERM